MMLPLASRGQHDDDNMKHANELSFGLLSLLHPGDNEMNTSNKYGFLGMKISKDNWVEKTYLRFVRKNIFYFLLLEKS